jgi:CheY-like chemotaxis protein
MVRFLVVDDEPASAEGLSRLLIDDGHEVSSFTEGAEAVEALLDESYDAVVTDLEMPGVDGHEVVRVTRERQPHACLVVVTARAAESHDTLAQAGACIVADKPIDYHTITRTVTDCRSRGGPGAHGKCHVKLRRRGHLVSPGDR